MLVVKLGNTFHSKVGKMYLNAKIPVAGSYRDLIYLKIALFHHRKPVFTIAFINFSGV